MSENRPRRFLRLAIAASLVTLGAALLAGWWTVHRSLPRLDGSVVLPELRQEVIVDRDKWGIPWIRARSFSDLLTAQGYVTAQDRLWQMDLLRRAAAGELSEIFGPAALSLDRENRTLGLRAAAEQAAASLGLESKKVLDAYARGVNRYIEERHNRLPVEFLLLRYQPRPWTPTDTFLIEAYMWKMLTTTWKAKLNREKLTELVGRERARDLFVIDSPLDHYIVDQGPAKQLPSSAVPMAGSSSYWESLVWQEARGALGSFDQDASELIGSNNFVVSGEHTYSGKPLLANDTHLGLAVPDLWYLIHLTAPGWNVEGFALPGTPLVIIGHNDRIAWGFTNSNVDVQDLYIETFNPSKPLEYRVNGKWVRASERREIIHVKGRADEVLDVTVTRHGPIVYREGDRGYALRWTATEPGGLGFAYPQIGRAGNWNEFRDVMRRVSGPGQNSLYADVDGHIGFLIAARIPIRRNGDGALPVPGDTDDFEWIGYIPFDELPQALNPPGGIIATANARTVGPAYCYFLSERWAAPYRTERLYELLGGQTGLRAEDCNRIQNDIVSLPNLFLARQLVSAIQKREPRDVRALSLIQGLAGWDGRASADSVETSFLEYTRHMLFRNLLQPHLKGRIADYELWEPESVYNDVWWRDKVFLENVLRDRPAAWLPKPYRDYDELLVASADEGVVALEKATGKADPSGWAWGRLHPLLMLHPLGRSGVLRHLLSIGPYAQSGTVDTVKAMGYNHGPAMRFVADLANFDNSRMGITTGESGQYGSLYYRDQFAEWFAGRGISAPFSNAAEKRAHAHRLLLLPASSATH